MNINLKKIIDLEKKANGDFFILKIDNFSANVNEFQNAFQRHYKNFRIGYSYKTNYMPYVCKVANDLGTYAEIVSELELKIASRVGVSPENIIYNGPAKTKESLEYCLLNNAKINIDNISELLTIVEIVGENPNKVYSVGIRLNFDLDDGFFSRFGLEHNSKEVKYALEIISKNKNLKLVGLHTHSTRKDKSPDIFLKKLEALIGFAKTHIQLNDLEYLDIGGGFYGKMDENIKSQFDDDIPTYDDYGTLVAKAMKRFCSNEKIELIIEPGVAITSNILDYFAKIIDIKTINNKMIALTSGSFHNIKPSGHKKNLTMKIHTTKHTEMQKMNEYEIVGYTCLENDCLYDNYKGVLSVDDFCQFKNVGAYTIVFKPPFIKLAPPVFLISNGKTDMVRAHEKFEKIFDSYNFKI